MERYPYINCINVWALNNHNQVGPFFNPSKDQLCMIAKTFGTAAGHFFQIRGIGEKPRHPMIAIALGLLLGFEYFLDERKGWSIFVGWESCSYSKKEGEWDVLFFGWIGYIRNWINIIIFKDSESLQRNEPWTDWIFGTVWYSILYDSMSPCSEQVKYLWYTLVNYCKMVWELYPEKQLRQMANYAFSSIFRCPIPPFLWVSFYDCRPNKTQPLH